MKILAIETSCDETSAAVLEVKRGGVKLLSNVVLSQIDIHRQYGGVVPEVAARHHVKNIIPVINQSLVQAKTALNSVDLLAVTKGPGLITSLVVGVETAKAISYALNKPLLPVNHMYAHMAGNFLGSIKFPAVCLIVSGGHTELIYLKDYHQYKKIGQTVDDAVGEAFDKVAKLLGLGYPGGPIVSAEAEKFQILNFKSQNIIKLPRPMLNSRDFDFSFSGLKTAVLYIVKKMKPSEVKKRIPEICHEFQEAAVEVLVSKALKAANQYKVKTIMLAGGVAANKRLRGELEKQANENKFEFFVPDFNLCTDNAGMVALAAYYLSQKQRSKLDQVPKFKADPGWEII